MEVKNYSVGDEVKILELFKLTYGRELTLDKWKWRFANNPFGNHLIKLMWDGDVLAGHYAVSPLEFVCDDQIIKGTHSLTTMTHPDYGGRGIFKTLSKELYHTLEMELGYKMIWGFPNNNSHFGFINRLGWQDIGLLHVMSLPVNSFKRSGEDVVLLPISRFSDKHELIFKAGISQDLVHVHRTTDYLNWRYLDNPTVSYHTWELIQEGKTNGIITVKHYPLNDEMSLFDLNIVELVATDPKLYPLLIQGVLDNNEKPLRRVTVWKNIHNSDFGHFERIGFVPEEPLTYMAARINPVIENKVSDIRNWYFSLGDSDVY